MAPAVVRLTIALNAPSSRGAQDILDALRFVVPGTRLEPGCVDCSAWIEPDATIRYVEEWTTEIDMRHRVQSPDFTTVLAILEAAREPRVQFDFVAASRGLDYIAEARGQKLP